MRVAFKVGYIGERYKGSQYQKNVRTVEGELFKAFKKMELFDNPREARFATAGRTDAGVHAIGQVIAFDVQDPKQVLPRIINSYLPDDIFVWARALVNDTFDPRGDAEAREYRYILHARDLNIPRVREAAKLLVGTHDFSNFTRKAGEKRNIRTVKSVNIRVDADLVMIDILANGFTWNMVRNIIRGLEMVGYREREVEWFEDMLNPEQYEEHLEPAPPYGLILKNVIYRDVTFEVDDYSKKKIMTHLRDYLSYHLVSSKIFECMVGELESR
jgi:tRNA pseudouridine38-40 synthase